LRWRAGQCDTDFQQWDCLSKQIRLQLQSVVSVDSFKDRFGYSYRVWFPSTVSKTDSVTATGCGFCRQFQRQIRLQLQGVVSVDSFKDRFCYSYRVWFPSTVSKTGSVTATECGFRRQFQRQIRLQLQSVVSIDSFKDLQYFAVVGIEMASRRITEGR